MMDILAAVPGLVGQGPRQHDRLLRLHTPLGRDALVVETLDAIEVIAPGIDGPAGFRLELIALAVDTHLDLPGLLGQPVLLELQTAASHERCRPFHGHVTAFARLGSNGGLARYRLTVEPWLALLRERVDSYVFQDMTVVEIVESVFDDYAPKAAAAGDRTAGKPVPAWRWNLADRDVYRKRSLTTQYEESDLAFVERLLAEEGLFYWFEHTAAPGDDSLGTHTLVLADHNDAFADLGAVRFHRSDVTEREDAIQHWSVARRWRIGRVHRASWDYRRLDTCPVEVAVASPGPVLTGDVDTVGPYAWPDRATGERLARQQHEALQLARATVSGVGTWRRLQPGSGFELTGHPAPNRDADRATPRFHCVRVHHRARNNVGAEIVARVEQQLGQVLAPAPALPEALVPLTHEDGRWQGATDNNHDGVDYYRNTFLVVPAITPYRARIRDDHGLHLHPKPRIAGTQTAIVVTDGAPIQTDRDHRIKLQFPWQRGADASSGLSRPAGDDNASGHADAWTWVRVATPWAGDNWGSVFLPRKGQEVLVAFLEGDIDRPVVIGSVYNGQGQDDAPHNHISGGQAGATGNAPAWFEGNGHPAVFTGFKTQMLADSQNGSGGYQQLRLDDTPGQGRAQASTTQHETTLTLGHLKGGTDNLRGAERGFGVELSTQAGGALRAGAGLLLSAEAGRQQLDAQAALVQLGRGRQLVGSLDEVARAQQAGLPDEADDLPAANAIDTLRDSLSGTHTGHAAGAGIAGGDGEVPAWSRPAILATSPDGIASVTPADQVWVSGTQTLLSADKDLQWLSQGESVLTVAGGIALYGHGTPAPAGKPNQETGIALHAAQGQVSARAHRNVAKVAAQGSVKLASTAAHVELAAPTKHLLATATGAYIKLAGGNIELGAPGTIEFKAAKKEWIGPKAAWPPRLALPGSKDIPYWIALHYLDPDTGEDVEGAEYGIHFRDGEVLAGTLRQDGKARHDGIDNKPVAQVVYKPRPPDPERPAEVLEQILLTDDSTGSST